ncbi:aspartic peptidase domain-containing protein [Syncephalastrum racemosum]|uniref:rhizopuspepsin n=1 Tax=Syncephalastrum racemosum TaxID=13706 RepID=A0A1X2HD76_SYNRA|nr:aspartic peptidase domain-containing protein [Syncephalastrum racemosum]
MRVRWVSLLTAGLIFLFVPLDTHAESSPIRLPLRKRGKTIDHTQKLSRRQNHIALTSQLYNDRGSEYLVTVGIGTPPQNFTVALDTGSADLWVPSAACPTDECPFARFEPNQSSTYQSTNRPFDIAYGTGSANGTYVLDVVQVGDVRVAEQQFGLVSTTENIILRNGKDTAANGILGIGYPELTSTTSIYDPFVFNMAKQGLIPEAIFSIHMGSLYDSGWSGEIMFGGINKDRLKGHVKYAPVARLDIQDKVTYAYWMLYGSGIRVVKDNGGIVSSNDFEQDGTVSDPSELLHVPFPEARGVIIDTGTTLTYMESTLAEQILLSVAGPSHALFDAVSGTFVVDCALAHKHPPRPSSFLELSFARNTSNASVLQLRLPIRDLIIPLDTDNLETASLCMFGIAPWKGEGAMALSNAGMILIGDTILRSTYLVFDMAKNRIGFAPAINSSASVTGIIGYDDSRPSQKNDGEQETSQHTRTTASMSSAASNRHQGGLCFVMLVSILYSLRPLKGL